MKKTGIRIPEKARKHIIDSVKSDYSSIHKEWKKVVDTVLDSARAEERCRLIEKQKPSGSRVLEIGSGAGLFLAYLEKKGYEAYGIEPDKGSFECSKEIFRANKLKFKVKNGAGESMGFRDRFFDVVCSFQVIEHVKDPAKVFMESSRVLKKGGRIYFVIPNYFSFWEGHYGVFWLPLLPKFIGRAYLRVLGKDPGFLGHIKYITPFKVKRYCKEAGLRIISMGEDTWMRRMRKIDFKAYGHTSKLKKAVSMLKFLRLNVIFGYIFLWFRFYFPIILVAEK